MATLELKEQVHSQYGTGYGWGHTTNYGDNNNDNNQFYVGGSSDHYRSRLYFTIPEDIIIVSASKLVLELKNWGQNSGTIYTKRTRGYLSTTNTSSSDVDNLKNLANPVLSYMYSDSAGNNRITGDFSCPSGTSCFFIFNTADLAAGQTYYIYITPYGSDSDAPNDPIWSSTWMQWRNNPDSSNRLSLVLHYTNTITITYNANGGSGAPSATTHTAGVKSTISSTKPTKATTTINRFTITYNGNNGTPSKASDTNKRTTKYTFSHWNTKKDGSGDSYDAGSSITPGASNITLYAQYGSTVTNSSITTATASRNNTTLTRTISFNTDGGNPISALNSTATRTYTHKGWYTAASGGTYRTAGGATITPNATETWYAQWNSADSAYGAITLPTPIKAGYNFTGWTDGTNTYAGASSYIPASNVTLTAIWERIYHTVNIVNWITGDILQTSEVREGDSFTIPTLPISTYESTDTSHQAVEIDFVDQYSGLNTTTYIPVLKMLYFNNYYAVYYATTDILYSSKMSAGESFVVEEDMQVNLIFAPNIDELSYIKVTPPHINRIGYQIDYWHDDGIDISLYPATENILYLDESWDGDGLYLTPIWIEDTTFGNNFYIQINGVPKLGTPYVKVHGNYRKSLITFIKVNGLWKAINMSNIPTTPQASTLDSGTLDSFILS